MDIIARFTAEGLEEVKKQTVAVSTEMEDYQNAIKLAKKELEGMDETSDDFKKLSKEIQAAEKTVNSFANQGKKNTTVLRDMRETMVTLRTQMTKLEEQGLKGTEAYKSLERQFNATKTQAASLQDAIADIANETKTAASDTVGLDTAIRGLQLGVNTFGALQAASALFGVEISKLEETLVKLNAVMLLSNSIQQIGTELSRKDSVVIQAATVAKNVYSAAIERGSALMTAFGISSRAAWAMATLGLSGLVTGVIALVSNYDKLIAKAKELFGIVDKGNNSTKSAAQLYKEWEISIQSGIKQLEREATILEALGNKQGAYQKKREALIEQSKFIKVTQGEESEAYKDLQTEIQLLDISYNKLTETKQKNNEVSRTGLEILRNTVKELEREIELLISAGESPQSNVVQSLVLATEQAKKQIDEIEKNIKSAFVNIGSEETIEPFKASIIAGVIPTIQLLERSINDVSESSKKSIDEILGNITRAQQVFGQIGQFAINLNNTLIEATKARIAKEENALNEQRENGLISERRYSEELRKLKNKEAKRERAAQLIQAAFMIPQAILSTFANTNLGIVGRSIAASVAGAFALAQFAVLAASPLPKYRHGGVVSPQGLISGKSHAQGGIPIEVEGNEFLVRKEQAIKNIDVLTAINNGGFDDYMQKAIAVKNYKEIEKMQILNFKPIGDKLGWIDQRLKTGNSDRRLQGEQLLKTLKISKVRV